jgi:Flp pilus assembly protein TadD
VRKDILAKALAAPGDALISHNRMTRAIDADGRASNSARPEDEVLNRKLAHACALEGAELIRRSQFAVAEATLQRAIELDSQNPLPYAQLGWLYHLQGRLSQAYGAYQQAWALEPTNPRTLFEMGTLLVDAGDREQARAAFHQALALDPDCFEARAWLARLYSEEHNYEMAVRLLHEGTQRRYQTTPTSASR